MAASQASLPTGLAAAPPPALLAVVLLSLRAQLKAPASNTRPSPSMCLNVDGSAGSATRCMSLAWVPGSEGTAFVAAHRDGAVLLYHKARRSRLGMPAGRQLHGRLGGARLSVRRAASQHLWPVPTPLPLLLSQVVGSSSDTKLLARTSSSHALRPPVTQLQGPGGGGGAAAAAVSPDGHHVAVACRDGVLRVYSQPGGGLVGGFKVGGLAGVRAERFPALCRARCAVQCVCVRCIASSPAYRAAAGCPATLPAPRLPARRATTAACCAAAGAPTGGTWPQGARTTCWLSTAWQVG